MVFSCVLVRLIGGVVKAQHRGRVIAGTKAEKCTMVTSQLISFRLFFVHREVLVAMRYLCLLDHSVALETVRLMHK